MFEKYGIIMEDGATGEPRIRLYRNEQGALKGDALVSYFKPESVELCCNLLDDSDFRLGQPGTRIRVQEAVFKEKDPVTTANGDGEGNTAEKPKIKTDKKILQKKFQKMEK